MRRRGFTLIELLVVIAIITVLIAMTFAVVSSIRSKGARTACMAYLRAIGQSVYMYCEDEGFLPAAEDLENAIDGGILQSCGYDPHSYVENWNPEIGGNQYPGQGPIVAQTGAFLPDQEVAPNPAEVVCTYCEHGKHRLVLYLDGRVAQEEERVNEEDEEDEEREGEE